ncbi:hypothetical protein HpDR76_13010 [Helicobacter pylori]
MSKYTQEQIKNLVEGNLDWNTVLKMLSMPKDHERFQMYLKVLQDKVDFVGAAFVCGARSSKEMGH